jgi:mannitol/fructose-specific phosphotransferase system IIA component (Ntr-type)/galactitol-specific phosphotransferase system IIB component
MDTIYSEYYSVFHITKIALKPLENVTGNVIQDEEIGYFTILFGGAINAESEIELENERFKALIVCPNGVSSSLILESELRILFPNIEFIASDSLEGIKSIPKGAYNFIFSTVPLDTNKKVYVVKPIMNQLEKNKLINIVQSDWLITGFTVPNVDTIIETIEPYISLKDGVTKEQLYRALNQKINIQFEKEDNYGLKDFLTADYIHFEKSFNSWEEAIEKAAEPLLMDGLIAESYIEAMIQNIYQYGAYIYMGNQVALPHASPEDGVHETSFSMLVLEEPVDILADSDFRTTIIIVLASIDSKQHLNALNDLTTILSEDNRVKRLLQASDKQQILEIIGKDQ